MKTLKYLFIAALAIFSFNACEDVPEPYKIPSVSGGGSTGTTEEGVIFDQSFASSLGEFTQTVSNQDVQWANEYSSACISGHYKDESNQSKYKAGESYLVSPVFDLSTIEKGYVSLNHVICYADANIKKHHKVLMSTDYTGDATKATWTELDFEPVGKTSFSFGEDNIAIPESFFGQSKVHIAIKYTSTESSASTWEVKKLSIKEGDIPTKEEVELTKMTVTEAIAAHTGTATPAIVTGYIVGYIDGKSTEGAAFNSNATVETNIILADDADETDMSKCIPVQLPSGAVRSKINLKSNPANYKKFVTMTGSLETYFGVAGLKSVTEALFEGEESEGDDEEENKPLGNVYINETFAKDLGSFTTAHRVSDYAWKHEVYKDKAYAKVSGYANEASQDAESWLISPAMNFAKETGAKINFDYVINKGDASLAATNHTLMITDNYTGDFVTTKWTAIDFGATNNDTWTFQNSGDVAIPAEFMGKEAVVIAFKYVSTTSASSTWEVNNVVVSGEVGGSTEEKPGEGEEGGTTAPEGSIAAVIAAGAGDATATGTVIATYARGFVMSDETASILVYLGDDKEINKVGDVVIVSGTTSVYGGLLQFGNSSTVSKTGTAEVTHPSVTKMTGADMDNYLSNPTIKYVTYTGKLSISGYYYNVTIDGASKAMGSIAYPIEGMVDESLNGKTVTVTGYTVGASGTKYVNTMATSVVEAEEGGEEEGGEEDTPSTSTPMTVAEVVAAFNAGTTGKVVVTAYIVGTSEADKASFTPIIGLDKASNTNFIIADSADETDTGKCIPVQLPAGAIREALSLALNPGNLGKKVTLTAEIQRYFGMAGLKNTSAYSFENVEGGEEEGDEEDTPATSTPMTVADVVAAYDAGTTGEVVVTAYIVGTSEADKASFTPIIGLDKASNTNFIIADSADETDTGKCIPVQLPAGAIREALSLALNPGNLGKKVTLTANIEKYFGMVGLKGTSAYSFE